MARLDANEIRRKLGDATRKAMNEGGALEANHYAVVALEKMTKALASIDWANENPCEECGRKGISASDLAKSGGYAVKIVNDLTRLIEFARGNADSRREVRGLDDMLKFLTNEQFHQLQEWITQGQEVQKEMAAIEKPENVH